MIVDDETFSITRFKSNFFNAPAELQVYAIFICIISLTKYGFIYVLPSEIQQSFFLSLKDHAGIAYLFSLFWAGHLIYTKRNFSRLILIVFLTLPPIFFIFSQFKSGHVPAAQENPLLWIWHFLIPAVWICLLASPRISRFCLPSRLWR